MANKISFPRVVTPLIADTPDIQVNPKTTTIFGQISSTATAVDKEIIKDLTQNLADVKLLLGESSQLFAAVQAFRSVNLFSRVDVMPLLDESGSVGSIGAVDFTSSVATEAGSLTVSIANDKRFYKIDIVVGDTATLIGDKLDALILADAGAQVTSTNTIGDVALVALNKGTVADGYTLQIEGEVAGVVVTLTAFTGGATDPVMTGLETQLNEKTDIVIPFEYDRTALVALLASRFNIDNDILDGRMIIGRTDTSANLQTLGDPLNDQSLVFFGDKPVDNKDKKGSAILSTDYERAAHFAGIRSLRLEDGVSIADFMTTSVANDNIGGVHTSSLPYANTATLLPVIPAGQGFSDSEVVDIKASGISVMGNNLAGNTLIVGEVVTTYKTNVQGLDDDTYKFLNYVDTSTASREFIHVSLKSDYAQRRLTSGEAVAGYSFADVATVRASMSAYFTELGGADFVLLQSGTTEDGVSIAKWFLDNLTVVIDAKAGTINITSPLLIVTQTREIISPLSIKFNVNG